MNRVWLPVLLLLFLGGCTKLCTDASIEGSYELSVNGVPHILDFESSGGGMLLVSGKPVGSFRWRLAKAERQQVLELSANEEVLSTLSSVNPSRARSGGAQLVAGSALGPAPECKRDGRMQALVFSYDEGVEFLRIDE